MIEYIPNNKIITMNQDNTPSGPERSVEDNDDIYEINDIDVLRKMLVTKRADSSAWCKRAMQEVDHRRELQKEIEKLKAGFLATPQPKDTSGMQELEKQNAEWKEECERLANLVTFWQGKYNELNPGFMSPKIDNL